MAYARAVLSHTQQGPLQNHRRPQAPLREVDDQAIPKWLPLLLRLNFFEACQEHKDQKKNELNTYCIDCDLTMCQNCLSSPPPPPPQPTTAGPPHPCARLHHKLLQIRRYVYQSVVRVHDIQKFLDCSKIQPFTVNSAKVVLLNSKNNGKGTAGKEGHMCEICQRSISDSNRFCSIACKFRVFNKREQQQASTAAAPAPAPAVVSSSSPSVEEHNSNPINPLLLVDSREENPIIIKPPTSFGKRKNGIPRRAPFF